MSTSLELITEPNPILHKECEPYQWTEEGLSATDLVDEMTEILVQNNGVGLAAPQVGIDKQMFIMGNPEDRNSIIALFNPKIVNYSQNKTMMKEGCLSFPLLYIKMWRPAEVRVRYRNVLGETVTEVFKGLSARIVQHEYDHLLGKTFDEVAKKLHVTQAKKKRELYRRQLNRQIKRMNIR